MLSDMTDPLELYADILWFGEEFQRIDATFAPGEVSVVAGPNGSGKSTLLALLAQTARPTSGRIHYAPSLNHRSALRAAVGMVAHDAMLYPDILLLSKA